jgi:hypothetical protein
MEIPELLGGAVEANDLRKWPLTHGTTADVADLGVIREKGLVAGPGTNSRWFDEELGRTTSVFVAPANTRFNYGYGKGILVDPAVLQQPGVQFASQDVFEVVECLKVLLEYSTEDYAGPAKGVDTLDRIVAMERTAVRDEPIEAALQRIVRSEAFKEYYYSQHLLREETFFKEIEEAARPTGLNMAQYFNRTFWPPLSEIFIPRQVSPAYLLGYWDGWQWTPWANPSEDMRDHLEAYIWLLADQRR